MNTTSTFTDTIPSITANQQQIIRLLFRYRFLSRRQLQSFLHHRDHSLTSRHLRDLKNKRFIAVVPASSQIGSNPLHCLTLAGLQYAQQSYQYAAGEVQKRAKDAVRSPAFMAHCQVVTKCCLDMQALEPERHYLIRMPLDYCQPESRLHFLNRLQPTLYVSKQEELQSTRYLVEIFRPSVPNKARHARLQKYLEFLQADWTEHAGEPLPQLLIICPTLAECIDTKHVLRSDLKSWHGSRLQLSVTSYDRVEEQGYTSAIWEKMIVEPLT